MEKDIKFKRRLVVRSVVITVSVSLVVLMAGWAGLFDRLENMFYDSRMLRTASAVRPSDEIAVVLLDQESIDWASREFGWSWPWGRSVYGDIVRFFDMANAAAVTFDVLFTEPSVYGSEDDESFAAACRNYGRVVQTLYFDRLQGTHSGWKPGVPLPSFSVGSQMGTEPLLFPIDTIASSAAALGNITGTSDSDDTIRRAAAYRRYGDYYIPSLGVAPLVVAGDSAPNPTEEPQEGRLLRFQASLDSYVPYSASQILQSYYALKNGEAPLLDPEMFEGMYVFFGFYAPGLFDICTTPVSAVYPGVGVHITQLDNTLQNTFLRPVGTTVYILLVMLFALLGAMPLSATEILRLRRFNVYVSAGLLVVCAAILVIGAYLLFAAGIVVPMTAPLVALLFGFVLAVVVSYRQEGRQRRYLKSAFQQYLSPAVIENLIAHPERLSLGGERRRLSIYFSDVQGFTSISEKLTPEEVTSLLNSYLSVMSAIILESGGTIDKYVGDAIVAFWNAPVEVECHARLALEAAIKCQEDLARLRTELQAKTGCTLYMRIGLNTGDAVVGNMGSCQRFNYTMLGDSVNLASRLESLNKQFGTYIMCTSASKEEAEAAGTKLKFRELARVAVVGKKEAVTIYEPFSEVEFLRKKDSLEAFSCALKLFYDGKFSDAERCFALLQEIDPPAASYVQKCHELMANPPDMSTWQGVWVATSK